MKVTLKNLAWVVTVLALVLVILGAVDEKNGVTASTKQSSTLRITVTDLDGKTVSGAKVTVQGKTWLTDNNGQTPMIELEQGKNFYDGKIDDWFCVTIKVEKDGFVTALHFNAVIRCGELRKLGVKMYKADESELPYVCYVEAPPDEYVRRLVEGK